MIRKLSISRSTYLLKRRVSFLLITTGYTSHVFFFTTECCDFGDRQPCYISLEIASISLTSPLLLICVRYEETLSRVTMCYHPMKMSIRRLAMKALNFNIKLFCLLRKVISSCFLLEQYMLSFVPFKHTRLY